MKLSTNSKCQLILDGTQPDGLEVIVYNDKYTVIMLGDINGDGKLSPTDYVFIKNHIMQTKELEMEIDKKAADVNEDQKISPTDYVFIKNYIMN